jgi:hypothetical protein
MPSADDVAAMFQLAKTLVESGLLPQTIKTPAAAFAIVQKGRELGLPPMQSLSGIAVISGKPVCSSELMASLIYRDHGDNALAVVESTSDVCTIEYGRRGASQRGRYTFTIDDARRAGVAGGATWQKYPAAMLRARCISAVARMAFPDSIAGMYMPDELGADVDVDADGEVVIVNAPTTTAQLPSPRPVSAPTPTPAAPAKPARTTAEAASDAVKNGPCKPEQVEVIYNLALRKKAFGPEDVDKLFAENMGKPGMTVKDLTHSQAAKWIVQLNQLSDYDASQDDPNHQPPQPADPTTGEITETGDETGINY